MIRIVTGGETANEIVANCGLNDEFILNPDLNTVCYRHVTNFQAAITL